MIRYPKIPRSIQLAMFLALLAQLSACSGGEPMGSAVGSYSDVAILTDLKALGPVANQLQRSLEKPVAYSLKPEPMFNVDLFDMSDRRNAEIYKNVMVIGLVGGRTGGVGNCAAAWAARL